jgi:cyclopropane fatty-acyl-phospholipid synthase-like methyltransferase
MKGKARFVPKPLRPLAQRIYIAAAEWIDRLPHRRNNLRPIHALNFVGGSDYEAAGREFLKYHVDIAGLRPDERVLDVGCGIGRMAAPLTSYLDASGRYEGFDIVKLGIRWANDHITRQYPNFRFHHADILTSRTTRRAR